MCVVVPHCLRMMYRVRQFLVAAGRNFALREEQNETTTSVGLAFGGAPAAAGFAFGH
jgi:hypothetical protein